MYYTCGLLIHQAIDLALRKNSDEDIYSLWIEFRQQVEKGNRKGSETFLALTEKWTSKELVHKIKEVIENKLSIPEDALKQLSIGE